MSESEYNAYMQERMERDAAEIAANKRADRINAGRGNGSTQYGSMSSLSASRRGL